MEIEVDPELLHVIATLEEDTSKVIREALNLWLKGKIPTCPITNRFCVNVQGSCNECPVTKSES